MKYLSINDLWKSVLNIVKTKTDNAVGVNVHMKDAVPVLIDSTSFTIAVPLALNQNMINLRYKKYIESALEQITSQKIILNVILKSDAQSILDKDDDVKSKYLPDLSVRLNPKYTVENFVIGSSNAYAVAAAISATKNPGHIYNPLFLYGHSGVGKTHLMFAIGNRIKANYPRKKIIYVTSEEFMNDFIDLIGEGKGDVFRNKYRSVDVLLIDDVQFFKKKEATQEEFFHTFNELYNLNKQIVITSDRPPSELTTLTERLRNRCAAGVTIDITVPNYETRIAILQKKAAQHNITVDNEVLAFVAERIKSNVRELEGVLINLISIAEISNKIIDIPLAENVLKSYIPQESISKITPDKIVQKVSTFYNISIEDLTGKSRVANVVTPRQIAMYLCHTLTDMNFTAIGRAIGGKDRTTVQSNVKKIIQGMKIDDSLKSDINYIIKDLQSN